LWQKNHLVSMSLSGNLNFLDVNAPAKPRLIVKGHNKFITAIAHDAAKKKVYTGAYDSLIVGWDIDTGLTSTFEGKGHTNQINQLHVTAEGLVSASMDDSVRYTPLTGGYGAGTRLGSEGPANSVATNESGSISVSVSNSHISVSVGKKSPVNTAAAYGAKAVSLAPGDKEVAVGGANNFVYIYSLNGTTLAETHKLEGHRGPLSAMAYSKNGKYLASADTNREIIIWDVATKAIKVQGWVFHTARVNSLAWSPDSVHLVSGSLDQNLIVWNVDSPNTRIVVKNSHHGGVNAAIWLDNNIVASAGQDCCWKTWKFTF
jgi:WD40 repeat protein